VLKHVSTLWRLHTDLETVVASHILLLVVGVLARQRARFNFGDFIVVVVVLGCGTMILFKVILG
jgi:hypothetical protein